jgi:hypothetical protein
MDKLRKPFFFIAVALMAIVVLMEVGSMAVLENVNEKAASLDAPRPGYGIPYMALLDGLILYTVSLMGLSLLVPERIQGRLQGIATLILSLLLLLGCIVLIVFAFVFLMLMVTLFLSPPFGTIAYLAIFGDFDRQGASITLALIMTLKLVTAGCLVLAHQRFLQNKGLVLIILTSLLGTFIVGLLHGLVPGILVSITDAIAGIIAGILAAIWAIVFLIGSIISIVKAIH